MEGRERPAPRLLLLLAVLAGRRVIWRLVLLLHGGKSNQQS